MTRYDLRKYKNDFYPKMGELIKASKKGEALIFMFEIGDFTSVQKSADLAKELGCELMNSVKYNEVDWTLVVRK